MLSTAGSLIAEQMLTIEQAPTIELTPSTEQAPIAEQAPVATTLYAQSLKAKTASVLTPRVNRSTQVETIVADVQSHDEFSTMPPTQSTKPKGLLQRLWSRVVSWGKKVISAPVRLFKSKR
jgi:hypothetical protein